MPWKKIIQAKVEHYCPFPSPAEDQAGEGSIWECPGCGQWWEYRGQDEGVAAWLRLKEDDPYYGRSRPD